MVNETIDMYGELNFAHNNAGVEGDTAPLAEVSEEDWDGVLDVNLKGVWRCMKHEIPSMTESGGGNIVNTSSISGLTGIGPGPYIASKHGVIGLTRKAAVDHADDGLRVNAVCPGVIDTPMVRQSGDPDLVNEATAAQPISRRLVMFRRRLVCHGTRATGRRWANDSVARAVVSIPRSLLERRRYRANRYSDLHKRLLH
jgi:NAD(P)-dependent dehydrogenase (short-subunit alcohol dehydrogenase family)